MRDCDAVGGGCDSQRRRGERGREEGARQADEGELRERVWFSAELVVVVVAVAVVVIVEFSLQSRLSSSLHRRRRR